MTEAINALFGMLLLHFLISRKIVLQRTVGNQFDVVQPHQFLIVQRDAAVARGDVDDRVIGQRLPNRSAPAGVESVANLVGRVGRRTAGQPERIGRFDAREIALRSGIIAHELDLKNGRFAFEKLAAARLSPTNFIRSRTITLPRTVDRIAPALRWPFLQTDCNPPPCAAFWR